VICVSWPCSGTARDRVSKVSDAALPRVKDLLESGKIILLSLEQLLLQRVGSLKHFQQDSPLTLGRRRLAGILSAFNEHHREPSENLSLNHEASPTATTARNPMSAPGIRVVSHTPMTGN
jgi:hypothetical protein